MPAPRSLRLPPKIGVNSNTGRVVRSGAPPMIMGRAGKPMPRGSVPKSSQSAAPVCPVTRSELPPSQPGISVPIVPKPGYDIPSIVQAVNAIINYISEDAEPTIRWLEKYRETDIVRIENPNDSDQWVEVERIIVLVMEDQITGDLWYWELGESNPPAPAATATTAPDPFAAFRGLTGTVVRPPGSSV